jgi:hypothetical protein
MSVRAPSPRTISPSVGKLEVEFDNVVTLAVPAKLIQGLAGAGTADLSKIESRRKGRACTSHVSTPTCMCPRCSTASTVRRLG